MKQTSFPTLILENLGSLGLKFCGVTSQLGEVKRFLNDLIKA